jgi:DNA-directed RNA polymerase subunit RPC12/RpoP
VTVILRQLGCFAVALLVLILLYPIKWLFFPATASVCLFFGLLIAIHVEQKFGIACPRCRRRKLELVGSNTIRSTPPAPFFYRCPHCRARVSHQYKRGWRDASAPDFDQLYLPKETEEVT